MKNFKEFLSESSFKIGQKVKLLDDFKGKQKGDIGVIKKSYSGMRLEIGFSKNPKSSIEGQIFNDVIVFLEKDFDKIELI